MGVVPCMCRYAVVLPNNTAPCRLLPRVRLSSFAAAVPPTAVRFVSDRNLILTPSSNTNSSICNQPSGMHVPRGSILCICPIESHHDSRLYPDEPWAFKPDR